MVLILNEQSAWLYPPILTDSSKMDYSFQRACVQPPTPLRRGVCVGGGDCTQASPRQIIHFNSSLKTTNNNIPVSIVFNDSEGLYWTTVCRCLVRRPHYSARLMRFGRLLVSGHVVQASSLRKCLDRDCVGGRRTRTRHGNVYRNVREKQGVVVYRQRVL